MSFTQTNIKTQDEVITAIKLAGLLESWILELDQITGEDRELVLTNPDSTVSIAVTSTVNPASLTSNFLSFNVFSSYDPVEDIFSQQDGYNIQTQTIGFKKDLISLCTVSFTSNRLLLNLFQNGMSSNAYVGKYLPFGSPTQQPNPFCINTQQTKAYNKSTNLNGNFITKAILYFDGSYSVRDLSIEDVQVISKSANDSYQVMFPILYYDDGYAIGELDSMYLISTITALPFYEFTISSQDYLVLDAFRTSECYYAIKKDI